MFWNHLLVIIFSFIWLNFWRPSFNQREIRAAVLLDQTAGPKLHSVPPFLLIHFDSQLFLLLRYENNVIEAERPRVVWTYVPQVQRHVPAVLTDLSHTLTASLQQTHHFTQTCIIRFE